MTTTRTIGVSEARRLLPEIVERISQAGGRVDITRHGHVTVSIVRTADLERRARNAGPAQRPNHPPAALRMELLIEEGALDEAIRGARTHLWATSGEVEQLTPSPPRAKVSKRPRAESRK